MRRITGPPRWGIQIGRWHFGVVCFRSKRTIQPAKTLVCVYQRARKSGLTHEQAQDIVMEVRPGTRDYEAQFAAARLKKTREAAMLEALNDSDHPDLPHAQGPRP